MFALLCLLQVNGSIVGSKHNLAKGLGVQSLSMWDNELVFSYADSGDPKTFYKVLKPIALYRGIEVFTS